MRHLLFFSKRSPHFHQILRASKLPLECSQFVATPPHKYRTSFKNGAVLMSPKRIRLRVLSLLRSLENTHLTTRSSGPLRASCSPRITFRYSLHAIRFVVR